MLRRDFIKRISLALAGGLILGDAVLEQYERLTHKPVFQGWTPLWVCGPVATVNDRRYIRRVDVYSRSGRRCETLMQQAASVGGPFVTLWAEPNVYA